MKHAIFAGSFDPPTVAHFEVLQRARQLFEKVTVVVAHNGSKGAGLLTPAERAQAWGFLGADVTVADPKSTIVETADRLGASYIVRGIRGASDIEGEQAFQRFVMVASNDRIQVTHVLTPAKMQHISSTAVRAIVGLRGWENLILDMVFATVSVVIQNALIRRDNDRLHAAGLLR